MSVKSECLNHLLILGLSRLQSVLDCYIEYFNEYRPNQGIDNKVPVDFYKIGKSNKNQSITALFLRNIVRRDFLGGLLRSYQRAA